MESLREKIDNIILETEGHIVANRSCSDKILALMREALPIKREQSKCDCVPFEGCGCIVKDFNQAIEMMLEKINEK